MKIVYEKLPTKFKAYFRMCPDGFITIVINNQISWIEQRKAYLHELEHIHENDLFCNLTVAEIERIRHSFPRELEESQGNLNQKEEVPCLVLGRNQKTQEEIDYEEQQEMEKFLSALRLRCAK